MAVMSDIVVFFSHNRHDLASSFSMGVSSVLASIASIMKLSPRAAVDVASIHL